MQNNKRTVITAMLLCAGFALAAWAVTVGQLPERPTSTWELIRQSMTKQAKSPTNGDITASELLDKYTATRNKFEN